MKLLIIAVVLLLAAADPKYHVREDIAEQWEQLWDPYKQKCIQESGVNQEDVHDFFKRGYYPNDTKFKCYVKCIGMNLKQLTKDGRFDDVNVESSVKGADMDIIEQSIRVVKDVTDACEKYYLYLVTAVSKIAVRYPPNGKI